MIHYMTTKGVGDAWVGNELRVVTGAGIPVRLHALNEPEQTYFSSSDIERMNSETRFIYPLPVWQTMRDVAAAPFRFRSRFFAAAWNALTGPRESIRNRFVGIWHFLIACHWASGLRSEGVDHIHSQWIHSGGTVAMYGAWLTGTSFSFTGHAADLFRNRSALTDKIRRAEFIICISEFHRQFYLAEGARAEQLQIAYCGIDTSHFTPKTGTTPSDGPVRILSSGRLVDKKGFDVLIRASAILRERGVDFTCLIGGSGPLESDLRALITASGLDDVVTLTGEALKQEDIPSFMYQGDIYCLPCIWAADNDVDGLPQMLMEALACGLPAISTRLVGIPDLIIDGQTGLLVEPEDATALADALQRLGSDRAFAAKLAKNGRKHLVETFDLTTCLDPLIERFRAKLEPQK